MFFWVSLQKMVCKVGHVGGIRDRHGALQSLQYTFLSIIFPLESPGNPKYSIPYFGVWKRDKLLILHFRHIVKTATWIARVRFVHYRYWHSNMTCHIKPSYVMTYWCINILCQHYSSYQQILEIGELTFLLVYSFSLLSVLTQLNAHLNAWMISRFGLRMRLTTSYLMSRGRNYVRSSVKFHAFYYNDWP